jgi:hypothetical protein
MQGNVFRYRPLRRPVKNNHQDGNQEVEAARAMSRHSDLF